MSKTKKEKKHKKSKDTSKKSEGAIEKKKHKKDKKHKNKKDKKHDDSHSNKSESSDKPLEEQVVPRSRPTMDLVDSRQPKHPNTALLSSLSPREKAIADPVKRKEPTDQTPSSFPEQQEQTKPVHTMKREPEQQEIQSTMQLSEEQRGISSTSSVHPPSGPNEQMAVNDDASENENENENENESASDSDSTSNEEEEEEDSPAGQPTRKRKRPQKGTVTQHRLQPRLHREFEDNENVTTREKYSKRRILGEGKTIKVSNDAFISDSDSDSSSEDENDDGKPRCPWHQTPFKDVKRRVDKYGWEISIGHWTDEERLKLEKRVKKVCKQEGLSLEDFRDMVQEPIKRHLQFWWKIAKDFPDRALYHIARHTRTAFHAGQYRGRWTEEEDKKLLDVLGTSANDYVKAGKTLNRSPDACRARARVLRDQKNRVATEKKTVSRFTKDDIAKLKEAAGKYEAQSSSAIPWVTISKDVFDSKFTPTQLQKKFWDSGGFLKMEKLGKKLDIRAQLALFKRMRDLGWRKESDIVFNRIPCEQVPFTHSSCRNTYFKIRTTVPDFEKKSLAEILDYLIELREEMVKSLDEANT